MNLSYIYTSKDKNKDLEYILIHIHVGFMYAFTWASALIMVRKNGSFLEYDLINSLNDRKEKQKEKTYFLQFEF